MQNILLNLFALFALAIAVPLNINLGAYSPALVVGDGEISFTGKQDVATLMNALEGAAVNAAANNAAGAPANAVAGGAAEGNGIGPAGNVASPVPVSPASQDPNTVAIAAMQTGVGLGNDLEPRVSADIVSSAKRDVHISKRDLAGFDRALNYATAALKTSPGVELGTGEGGSGVGIKQLPGGQAAVAKPAKRDMATATPLKRRNRVTTLLVRGIDFDDVPAKREAASLQARTPAPAPATIASRDIDSVNLNIKEARGLLLRVIEERDANEELDEDEE